MRFLIVLSAAVAVCVARPGYIAGGVARLAAPAIAAAPVAYSAVVAPAIVSEQHHAQDTIGQYRYGYSDGLTTKGEFRSADGITQGAYAYVDGNGEVQNVAYTADGAGFRVAASNLPVAPAVPEAPELQGPAPVQDTAEVVAAKAAHEVAIGVARAAATPAVVAAAPASVAVAAPAVIAAAPARVAVAAPAVIAAAPAVLAARTVISAAPGSTVVASAVPASRSFAYTSVAAAPLTAAPIPYPGPQHIPAITASGVPVDTVEVQAARAADVVAHLNAKASIFG